MRDLLRGDAQHQAGIGRIHNHDALALTNGDAGAELQLLATDFLRRKAGTTCQPGAGQNNNIMTAKTLLTCASMEPVEIACACGVAVCSV